MAEPKLVIDGKEYPLPSVADLTMGDARILKRYTGLSLQQLEGAETSDPDFIAALCHVAFAHSNPAASFARIEAEVNKIKFAEVDFIGEEDGEKRPPSQNGSGSETPASGSTSEPPSDVTPETTPPPIGTLG